MLVVVMFFTTSVLAHSKKANAIIGHYFVNISVFHQTIEHTKYCGSVGRNAEACFDIGMA
jgi:hypothetical protein